MTFQEIHVSDNTLSVINTQFQACYSLWTCHCGIVSFSSSFIFSDNLVCENDWIILTMPLCLSDSSYSMPPSASAQQRQQLFDHVLDLLHNQDLDINLDRLFITRDSNYSYLRPHLPSQISLQWISFFNNYFCNALMNDSLHELPTFRRNDTTYSMIDYIFVNQAFRIQVTESSLHNLDASWAGHSLFSVTCCLDLSSSDPGLWR